MKKYKLRNGIVVTQNKRLGAVRVLSVPIKYKDKDGDNWTVGSYHYLDHNNN